MSAASSFLTACVDSGKIFRESARSRALWALCLGILSVIFVFVAANPQLVGGKLIADETGDWGAGTRKERLGWSLPGAGALPSVAARKITIKPDTLYRIDMVASCGPGITEFRLDLFGPGYDLPGQEVPFPCTGGHQMAAFTSGPGDGAVELRVFFFGETKLTVSTLQFREITVRPKIVSSAALLAAALSGLGIVALLGGLTWLVPAGLFCVFLFVYVTIPSVVGHMNGSDNRWYIPTALSILQSGSIDLSKFAASYGDAISAAEVYGVRSSLFGYVNFFPIGTAILALPFVFILRFFTEDLFQYSFAIACFFAAGSSALMFVVARSLTPNRWIPFIVSFLFAFATSHFSIHAGGLWSHNTSSMLFLAALAIVLTGGRAVFLLPFILFLGYLARPDFSLFILAILFLMLFYRREALVPTVAVLSVLLFGFFLWSYTGYGEILPPYYRAQRLSFSASSIPVWFAHLFSPNRGLFIFNPLLMLGAAGLVVALWRKQPHRLIFGTSLLLTLAITCIASGFFNWWGGHSVGPRILSPVIGLLAIGLVPFLDWAWGTSGRLRRGLLVAMAVTGVWGVIIHGRLATHDSVFQWNMVPVEIGSSTERIWDWTDMQMFR